MATINVLDSVGSTVALEKPLTPGQALMASSRPVVIASDQSAIPITVASVPSHAVTNAGTFAVQVTSAPSTAVTNAGTFSVQVTNANANFEVGGTSGTASHQGAPTVNLDPYSNYETVIAGQTDQIMGATGAQYDYLAGVLIVPDAAGCGAVSLKDGNGSAFQIFAGGGTTPLPSLVPFIVPLGIYALAATTPGWKLTTGANVRAMGIGKFT